MNRGFSCQLKFVCFALLTACPCLVGQEEAQPSPEASAKELQEYMKLIEPGDEHALFTTLVGRWTIAQKLWYMPGPPQEAKGSCEYKVVLGGRYLIQDVTSESPIWGKMNGVGTLAYDKIREEYVHTWIDSMGTGVMISRGKSKNGGKTVELHSDEIDPMTRAEVHFRTVADYSQKNEHTFVMYERRPDEEERKIMEIIYTRE